MAEDLVELISVAVVSAALTLVERALEVEASVVRRTLGVDLEVARLILEAVDLAEGWRGPVRFRKCIAATLAFIRSRHSGPAGFGRKGSGIFRADLERPIAHLVGIQLISTSIGRSTTQRSIVWE